MTKVPSKDIYRLWWEYLRQNPNYKELCDWWKKKRETPNLSVSKKFKKDKHGSVPPIVSTYMSNGDIHSFSFDEWWEYKKKAIELTSKRRASQTIRNYSEIVEYDIRKCIHFFKHREGREPSLKELSTELAQFLETRKTCVRLMVGLDQKTDIITNHFKKTIRDLKKDEWVKQYAEWSNKRHLPTSRIRYDELQRYLEVYKLSLKGLKIKDIIKKIGTKSQQKNSNDADVQRTYRAALAKAKRIIKNVEKGFFPGNY